MSSFPTLADDILIASRDALGVPAFFRPASGGTFPVTVIWDNPYGQIETQSGGVIESSFPSIGVRDADLVGIPLDDTLDPPGDEVDVDIKDDGNLVTYQILSKEPDGQAGTIFRLQAVPVSP